MPRLTVERASNPEFQAGDILNVRTGYNSSVERAPLFVALENANNYMDSVVIWMTPQQALEFARRLHRNAVNQMNAIAQFYSDD